MAKKKSNPKILILTQINPINVAIVYDEFCRDYSTQNEVFSPQIMALLGELSLKTDPNDYKHSYRVFNAAFVKNIKPAIQKMNPLKPWIFIGNCSKDSKINFDHILAIDGGEDFGNEKVWDFYIEEDNKLLTQNNIKPINYYSQKDAQFSFPTIQHLKLFLSTLNVKGDVTNEPTSK